jgi:hypothetical protein
MLRKGLVYRFTFGQGTEDRLCEYRGCDRKVSASLPVLFLQTFTQFSSSETGTRGDTELVACLNSIFRYSFESW